MSEFREELLVTALNKKRVIKIILTAVLLVFAFAFSTFFFSLLWDSQRPFPSDQLSEAEEEEGIPTEIPFPYNISDFQDLFSDLNLTTDQLSDLLDSLADMFDGDIDDLDLSDYGQALAALMFSEVEVFRIYDYDDYNEILTKFWKYESFDEYTGDGWHSSAATAPYSYYNYGDYFSQHWDKDLLSLKIPLTPSIGINSMVMPTLFHTPFIMENSIQANNMQGIPNLFKDEFNCTTLDIDFSMDEDVNMTYEMFGLDLPTNSEIDAVAIEPLYTPIPIKSKYLQLKGDTINVYISNNDDFAYHYNQINATILSSDNTFIVADKIRNYLQYNFIRISDPAQYNPAPDGYDQVEWFLEEGIGIWSDFTSAFCAFTRAFGIASRFVDGFNSFLAEEQFDNFEGKNTIAIKYKNMYNWAEIYIPTDSVTGDGIWIQMDIYYDNYGSVPPSLANYSLVLNSNFTAGYRGTTANLTVSLTLDGAPVEGATISFYDLTSLQTLGQFDTNLGGNASIIVDIDDLQVVGPHYIFAQFNPDVNDTTTYTVYGDIQVNLQNINPQEVNISIDTSTIIQGYVIDPINNQRVSGVTVEFVILQKGTNTKVGSPPFDITYDNTDSNGDFNVAVNVDASVPVGKYELRVDTNGSWYFNPYALGFVNDSSNKMDFNVTKGIVKKLWFYINNIPSDIPDAPIVKRNSNLILKAIVVNETNAPISNQNVDFYDYTRGVYIGSNITNSNGMTTLNYFIGNFATAGPNLLFGKLGINENYTYFILNEEPTISIISGPSPREINRTAVGASNTVFNIEGEIIDSINNNPIRRSRLNLKLFKGVMDYSAYLLPSGPFLTDFNGYFNLNFEVDPNTPTGNYTLRLDFNGTINRLGHPEYPAFFILPYINTSSVFTTELKILTPAKLLFSFWINGTVFNDYNQPVLTKNEDINLSVYLEWGASPIGDGEWIDFYDVTQDVALGSAQTMNGYTHLVYSTSAATVAGPHLIYARWGSNYNYSYYIYNKNISIDLTDGPEPREIVRSDPGVRIFNIHGYVNDSNNGATIKYAQINVYMYDGLIDVSFYLMLQSGTVSLDETGEFNLDYMVLSSTPEKNYTIQVEFSGVFLYSWPNNQFNEHDFYLGGYSNFTDLVIASYEIKVIDPENLDIFLSVEGNPTLTFYDDANPPEPFKFGETAHIQVQIIHGLTKIGKTVYLYDDFTDTLITSWVFNDESGFIQFNISTNTLHAGLIRFRVNYDLYSTFNTTYIVINETIPISINLNRNVVQRNFHQFNVNGILQQNGTNLDGLVIGLILINASLQDASSYLNLNGPQFRTVSGGSYLYFSNSIFLNCPQGSYYLLIYFTGGINELGISLTSYMDTSMSMILPINITAGTVISGEYDTNIVKDDFYEGDDLYVYGFLTWDNGTAMSSMEINVTVRDSIGNVLGTAIGVTDGSGFFNVTIVIGSWPANAEIWVTFYPEDNFSSPDYYYIEFYEIELFRAP